MFAGLLVAAASHARAAPGCGRPSSGDNKGGQTVALGATRRTPAGTAGGSTEEGLVWWWPNQDSAAGDHLPDLLPTPATSLDPLLRIPSTSPSRSCLQERLDGPDTEKSKAAVDCLVLADLWEHFAKSSAYGLAVLVRLLGHTLPLRHPAVHSHQPHHLQGAKWIPGGALAARGLQGQHTGVVSCRRSLNFQYMEWD